MIDGGLSGILREYMPEVHWQRIETGGTGRGIPDLNGCMDSCESWCELKATEAWAVVIRPEQVAWAERRARAGGRVFLITRRMVSSGPRRKAADEVWIHRGSDMRGVSMHGLKDGPAPIYRGEGGPANWLWPVIEEILFGGGV